MKKAHIRKMKDSIDGAPAAEERASRRVAERFTPLPGEQSSANRDVEHSEASVAVLTDTLALGLLEPGEQAEILALPQELKQCRAAHKRNEVCGLSGRLQRLGLTPGVSVEMADNDGSGFVRLRVDGTQLVLGRFLAMKIVVRKKA